MSQEIRIPSVGESITSGTIAEWHIEDGAFVRSGDALLSLETDKISTEVPAEQDGIVRILISAGEEVDIGAVVGTLEKGAPPVSEEKAKTNGNGNVAPSVRKLADENGVDLNEITGTGAKGGITKADVEAHLNAAKKAPDPELKVVPSPKPTPPESSPRSASKPETGRVSRKKMSPLRRKIATHLVNAQQSAAMLTTFNEVDMSEVIRLRKTLQPQFLEKHGVKLGFMSFFVKAVVEALKTVPQVNARIDGEDILQHHFYDIGVAIGTERGLMVPVLRDCEQKNFATIEQDIIDYAARARDGKIEIDDLQGGVFTISNGGIYGSMLSTPILNAPQSAILGMHSIDERPVAINGEVVIRPMMYLAMSYDHRLIDGKEAVTFLGRIKECIEQPAWMMVGV